MTLTPLSIQTNNTLTTPLHLPFTILPSPRGQPLGPLYHIDPHHPSSPPLLTSPLPLSPLTEASPWAPSTTPTLATWQLTAPGDPSTGICGGGGRTRKRAATRSIRGSGTPLMPGGM